MKELSSFQQKGPFVKLMRWFSFFEAMAFHSGDLFAMKMVLEDSDMNPEEDSAAEVEEDIKEHQDHHRELQNLNGRR